MSSPYFYGSPKSAIATVTASLTTWVGNATLATIFTGASAGSMVVGVVVEAGGATTDGYVKFFVYDGTNSRRVGEIAITSATVAGSSAPAATTWSPPYPLVISSGWAFQAAPHKGELFDLVASFGNLS